MWDKEEYGELAKKYAAEEAGAVQPIIPTKVPQRHRPRVPAPARAEAAF